jgi:hypothetical protein
MLFAKSPTQMRREAEARLDPKPARKPRPPKPRKIDPEARRLLDRANWAAYLRTGRAEPR